MHDTRRLAISRLYKNLENFAFSPTGRKMCLNGDPAYPLRMHLQVLFRVGILNLHMPLFNESMSTPQLNRSLQTS